MRAFRRGRETGQARPPREMRKRLRGFAAGVPWEHAADAIGFALLVAGMYFVNEIAAVFTASVVFLWYGSRRHKGGK